jgi:hypothetical protein
LNPKDCEKTYLISDKELELILQTNENLPTDELEIPVRDLIVMEIRERQPCPHTSAPAPANPCIENGCTDIENCDEICEHMRIYSPAYVRGKVKAAREQEQQRINAVIKELEHLRDGQYNDVVGHNVRYAYDYAIILLRAQQEPQQDQR